MTTAKKLSALSFVVCLLLVASETQAVILPPGGAVGLSGTTSAARPELAGPVIHDTLLPFQIFSGGGALLYEGNLQNRVVRSTLDGTLDFYYRIRDTVAGLNGVLTQADTIDFAGWSTDVDYRTDGLGMKPTTRATRSAAGDNVTLIYGNSVFSGEESLFTFIKTDALQFAEGETTLRLQSGESVVLTTVAPVVPEPTSICLFALGGLWLASRVRRK